MRMRNVGNFSPNQINTNMYPFREIRTGFLRRSRIELERYREAEMAKHKSRQSQKDMESSQKRLVHTTPTVRWRISETMAAKAVEAQRLDCASGVCVHIHN